VPDVRVRVTRRVQRLSLPFLLGTFFFAWSCGHAAAPQPQTAPSSPAPPASATPGLFLYEVSGGARPSYLLGTIHVGFGFDEVLTEAARRDFTGSERVWLEADVASANPMQLVSAAVLPPNQSLRTLVGEPTWVELTKALAGQIPEPVLDRLKPWMPAMIVGLTRMSEVLAEVKPGTTGEQRMDVELLEQAKTAGKELHYFETVEEQIAVFDAIPVDEQVRELRHTLGTESRLEGRALLQAFASGDEPALEHALFMGGSVEQSPAFYGELLDRRNEKWLPKLVPELERGGAFVAVGAAHLLGEHGLLRVLEQRGYRVSRVE
jgi:uncharacterized protein YbaP (TraB family)